MHDLTCIWEKLTNQWYEATSKNYVPEAGMFGNLLRHTCDILAPRT